MLINFCRCFYKLNKAYIQFLETALPDRSQNATKHFNFYGDKPIYYVIQSMKLSISEAEEVKERLNKF